MSRPSNSGNRFQLNSKSGKMKTSMSKTTFLVNEVRKLSPGFLKISVSLMKTVKKTKKMALLMLPPSVLKPFSRMIPKNTKESCSTLLQTPLNIKAGNTDKPVSEPLLHSWLVLKISANKSLLTLLCWNLWLYSMINPKLFNTQQ